MKEDATTKLLDKYCTKEVLVTDEEDIKVLHELAETYFPNGKPTFDKYPYTKPNSSGYGHCLINGVTFHYLTDGERENRKKASGVVTSEGKDYFCQPPDSVWCSVCKKYHPVKTEDGIPFIGLAVEYTEKKAMELGVCVGEYIKGSPLTEEQQNWTWNTKGWEVIPPSKPYPTQDLKPKN